MVGIYSKFGLYAIKGIFDNRNYEDKAVNLNKKFPEIKPMTVKEVVELWRGK
jgi:hypothetical protein